MRSRCMWKEKAIEVREVTQFWCQKSIFCHWRHCKQPVQLTGLLAQIGCWKLKSCQSMRNILYNITPCCQLRHVSHTQTSPLSCQLRHVSHTQTSPLSTEVRAWLDIDHGRGVRGVRFGKKDSTLTTLGPWISLFYHYYFTIILLFYFKNSARFGGFLYGQQQRCAKSGHLVFKTAFSMGFFGVSRLIFTYLYNCNQLFFTHASTSRVGVLPGKILAAESHGKCVKCVGNVTIN